MLTCLQRMLPRLAPTGLCLLLLIVWPSALFASGGSSCVSGTTPAFAADPSVHIPGVFRPAVTGLTCDQIPSGMDSSDWESLTVPSRFAGHEQFQGLDALGDFLYVAYNAGIQVWNIGGANAEQPVEVAAADGFPPYNDWLHFPSPAEDDFFVEDIDVLLPSSGGSFVYIAVAARGPVGFSVWRFNTNNGSLTQLFQETSNSRMARIEEFDGPAGPVLYGFSGHENGVRVFNVTEAIAAAPCTDDASVPGSPCPNVFEGSLNTTSGGFIDTYTAPSGAIYLSNSDGNTINSLGVELWQINDPSNPGGAIKRFSGLNTVSFGTALFEKGGDTYLAVLERVSTNNRIKMFDIDACLTSNCNGSNPGTLTFNNLSLPPYSTRQFLTYSEGGSNHVPYLYYGLRASSLNGDHVEQLLDLTSLGTGSQNITEMTTGGPTYFDNCQQQNLGYWSYYYPGNEFGAQNFTPRIGKFNPGTIYFYRAARGVLDVHVWEGGSSGDPNITTSVSSPQANYWMDEDIDFLAFGGNGCVPNPAAWVWTDITTPAGVSHEIVSQTGNQATIKFTCDDAVNRCADAAVSVNATNVDATCSSAVENSADITVEDPRLGITLTPTGGTFPQCTVIDFQATLVGRGPANFVWKVDGVPDNAGTDTNEDLSSLSFMWDTTNVVISDQIFTDGFESGNVSVWSSVTGLGGGALSSTNRAQPRPRGAGTPFNISIELTSAFSDPESASSTVNVEAVGNNPRFATGVDPITFSTPDGGATWDFHANSLDASDFNWEFEDSDGTDLCTFGASSNVACVKVSGGQDISHTWILQSGTRRVNLTITNCNASQEASASTSVTVVSTEPLEVTEFRLFSSVAGNPDCLIQDAGCIGLLGPPACICSPGGDAIFTVTATGSPTSLAVDWDGNGTFESSVPFATSITHVYPGVVNTEFRPSIKAVRNTTESAAEENREELLIQNF